MQGMSDSRDPIRDDEPEITLRTVLGPIRFGRLLAWLLPCILALPAIYLAAVLPLSETVGAFCVSIIARAPEIVILISFVAFCSMLGAFLGSGRLAGPQRLRRYRRGLILLPVVVFLTASLFVGLRIRYHGFIAATERASRVITALEQYHSQTGEYPGGLSSLDPDYLSRPDYTGMCAYPQFAYRRADESTRFKKYELSIDLPVTSILDFGQFRCFVFLPEGDYSSNFVEGELRPIGAWASVNH